MISPKHKYWHFRTCCFRKRQYSTLSHAETILKATAEHDTRPTRPLQVYKCPYGLHYHIGHKPKSRGGDRPQPCESLLEFPLIGKDDSKSAPSAISSTT